MNTIQPNEILLRVAFGAALLVIMATTEAQESKDSNLPPAIVSQQKAEIAKGDPSRWYQEDKTMAARLRTMRKEIQAALQEAEGACRQEAPAERKSCLNEARVVYQHDMANVRAQAIQSTAQR